MSSNLLPFFQNFKITFLNRYLLGMTEVEVGSAEEALDVLIRGTDHRQLACSALNAETARSYSVVNIRFVQAPTVRQVKQIIKKESQEYS